jgi:ABC-type multidrug transport system fused ATPase/permease subunit
MDIDPGRIRQAARAAYTHDFIEELPEGYDTIVGDRGGSNSRAARNSASPLPGPF